MRVIGKMAQLAATLDYENYRIFIGTYPNDPQTHADVEQVRAHFPNVHSVVCARPGRPARPTASTMCSMPSSSSSSARASRLQASSPA
jgi:hypothetical protein